MSKNKPTKNHTTLRLFLGFLLIGGIALVIDLTSFKLLLALNLYRPLATAISYTLGLITQFILNKFFNFRNFERSTICQLQSYLIISGALCVISVILLEFLAQIFSLSSIMAKLIAILINIPLSFLGHRYITFGYGIKGILKILKNKLN